MEANLVLQRLLRESFVGKYVNIATTTRRGIILVHDITVNERMIPTFHAQGSIIVYHAPVAFAIVHRRRKVYRRWRNEPYYDYAEYLYKATYVMDKPTLYEGKMIAMSQQGNGWVWVYVRVRKDEETRMIDRDNCYHTCLPLLSLYYRFSSLPYTPRP